ncbi:hypothetical protein BGZ99_009197 [Dissophora globulifera]|uniref:Uncharacterized protein n=1 Tax=Dissophora globulifera TaxID=979702 RepID=A0A9P6UNK3_9FUNG|nr:hypothetical protein BGZ99_009197 [Dissophora globulifera]
MHAVRSGQLSPVLTTLARNASFSLVSGVSSARHAARSSSHRLHATALTAQQSHSRLFSVQSQRYDKRADTKETVIASNLNSGNTSSFGTGPQSSGATPDPLLSMRQGDADIKSRSESGNEPGPLDGIRVLDLTRVLAGPYCTQVLGDLGAEIIKIENPKGGDDTRAWGPPFAKNIDPSDPSQESAYFLGVNRNKKSVTVNLRSSEGRQLIHDLIKKVDVLVENYVPGKLEEMGLGYEELSRLNPRLIYTSITGTYHRRYGQTGPYRMRPGYDVMIEAEAGLMFITGEENGTPVKVGVAVTDLMTGLYAHGAIMAALLARYRTGRGQHIDCSLIDTQVATLANIGSSYLIAGQEAKRMGTAHPSIVPYQVLPSKDSHIMIGAGNDGQFQILCSVLGLDSLCEDPAYKTNKDRVRHRKELISILTERLKTKSNDEWIKALEGRGIPFAPINNIAQTFAHPQVVAREMIQEIDHPKAGTIKMAGPAVKYSDTKPSIRIPPPVLGQHTDEVLTDMLGYDQEQIQKLRASKVV